MVQLKNVLPHHLYRHCRCNNSRMVAVIELVEGYGENITPDQVRKNAKSTACKVRVVLRCDLFMSEAQSSLCVAATLKKENNFTSS